MVREGAKTLFGHAVSCRNALHLCLFGHVVQPRADVQARCGAPRCADPRHRGSSCDGRLVADADEGDTHQSPDVARAHVGQPSEQTHHRARCPAVELGGLPRRTGRGCAGSPSGFAPHDCFMTLHNRPSLTDAGRGGGAFHEAFQVTTELPAAGQLVVMPLTCPVVAALHFPTAMQPLKLVGTSSTH